MGEFVKMKKSILILLIALLFTSFLLFGMIGWRTGLAIFNPENGKNPRVSTVNENLNLESDFSVSNEEIVGESNLITSGGGGSSGGSTQNENPNSGNNNEEINSNVYINSYNLLLGERNNFSIWIESVKGVYAGEFKINFNPSKIKVINVIEGDFLNKDGASTFPVISFSNEAGEIDFALTRFGTQENVLGKGIFFNVEFETLETGKTDLIFDLEKTQILNSKLNLIEINLKNGEILIS
jgi:hypothetical protein